MLAALRYFEAASRHLSFKKAASELHVTQGAVSQQIKQLEDLLGFKLFHRLPRQLRLSLEGEQFSNTVRNIFQDLERSVRTLRSDVNDNTIRLRIAPSLALRWLMPRLQEFYAQNPDVKLFVSADYGYIDPAERDFDIGIDLSKGGQTAFQNELLMPEYILPVCSPFYKSSNNIKSPGDILNCLLLHDAHAWVGEPQDAEWQYWLREAGIETKEDIQGLFFSLADLSLEAAANGQGVAMGRLALLGDKLKNGVLEAPFSGPLKSPADYYLIYPKEFSERKSILIVKDWLLSQANEFMQSVQPILGDAE